MKKSKKEKIKKEIEYEEAPSGYVTFYNYKMPLMKFDEGHGFIGTLCFDGKTDEIQCHFCGEWFGSLPHHLAREHNMSAAEYKKSVGLNMTTALISESMREKLIASGMDKRLQNLRNRKGKVVTKEMRAKISAGIKRRTAERDNVLGICPAQLIDRVKNKYIELGRTPSARDPGCSFLETAAKVYGSFQEVCRVAGIPYRKPSTTIAHEKGKDRKYTKEQCVEYTLNFFNTYNRLPRYKDVGKGSLWNNIKRYGYKDIGREALTSQEYKKPDVRLQFSKEDLVKFLRQFEKAHGRKPSVSDSKRGMLPPFQNYYYHFGNFKKAVALI